MVERKSPRWNISSVAWLNAPSSTSKSGAAPSSQKKLATTAAAVSQRAEVPCMARGFYAGRIIGSGGGTMEATQSADQKICEACRQQIHAPAEICPKCGGRQHRPLTQPLLLPPT